MAVGDVIAVVSTLTSWRSYQAAAGVEIIITQAFQDGGGIHVGLTDGTNYSYAPSPSGNYLPLIKLAINNTIYMQIYSANNASWSGIQIK